VPWFSFTVTCAPLASTVAAPSNNENRLVCEPSTETTPCAPFAVSTAADGVATVRGFCRSAAKATRSSPSTSDSPAGSFGFGASP